MDKEKSGKKSKGVIQRKRDLKKPQVPERKKGAPKWKRTQQEIELIEKRITQETPPPGVLYYKFKQEEGKEEETMT